MAQKPVSQVFGFLGSSLECTRATFDCDDLLPPCISVLGFDFASLWQITENYHELCPNGPWLVEPATYTTIALTNKAAEAIVGATYKVYPAADIWYRFTIWKFPLLQLLTSYPRPPISFGVALFVLVHLMGDPIGALEGLIRKFDGCQARAIFWQAVLKAVDLPSLSDDRVLSLSDNHMTREKIDVRLWKAFAIIADSYDEWGSVTGDGVSQTLSQMLQELRGPDMRAERGNFCKTCLMTASALAADRSTKFLPVVVAQAFFIGTITIAMIRTKSIAEQENSSTYINIEMHSIGFTALFFWLISAVSMTSVIGASHTAEAVPRILARFATDLRHEGFNIELPSKDDLKSDDRIWQGGIYSWQPLSGSSPAYRNALKELKQHNDPTTCTSKARVLLLHAWPWISITLPWAIFAVAILTGMGISFAVPPIGWSCHSSGEMIIALIWISSYLLSFVGKICFPVKALFTFAFVKDMLAFSAIMAMVLATQIGIYNSSSCYTKFGTVGLALPEQEATKRTLQAGLRIGGSYTVLVTLGVLAQLVIFPMLLLWRYHAAFCVFLQRDNGTSDLNYPRLGRVLAFCWRLVGRVLGCGSRSGYSRIHQIVPGQGPNETDQEVYSFVSNDGRSQTAIFHQQVPLGTDGAHEYLLSPSVAHFRNKEYTSRHSDNMADNEKEKVSELRHKDQSDTSTAGFLSERVVTSPIAGTGTTQKRRLARTINTLGDETLRDKALAGDRQTLTSEIAVEQSLLTGKAEQEDLLLHNRPQLVTWTCSCGAQLNDYYTEIVPGALEQLQQRLRQENSSSSGSWHAFWNRLVSWTTSRPSAAHSNSKNPADTVPSTDLAHSLQQTSEENSQNIPGNASAGRGTVHPLLSGSSDPSNTLQSPLVHPAVSYLLLCFPEGLSGLRLHHQQLQTGGQHSLGNQVTNDKQLFHLLRKRYALERKFFISRFRPKTVIRVSLAYFLVDLSDYVELKHYACQDGRVNCKCIPPPDMIQPAIHAQYHCVPRDPHLRPPIGTNYLTHYFQNPDCIKSENLVCTLNQVPKRLGQCMATSGSQRVEAWGLEFEEGWDRGRLRNMIFGIIVVGCLSFAILWSVLLKDMQSAFSVSSFLVAILAIIGGYIDSAGPRIVHK